MEEEGAKFDVLASLAGQPQDLCFPNHHSSPASRNTTQCDATSFELHVNKVLVHKSVLRLQPALVFQSLKTTRMSLSSKKKKKEKS